MSKIVLECDQCEAIIDDGYAREYKEGQKCPVCLSRSKRPVFTMMVNRSIPLTKLIGRLKIKKDKK